MERRARGPFEGGVAAEYQSVMSIGPNKVMNGNCEPPSGRTSIRSSRPVAQFPPLYPILSALAPFSIRHESSPLIDFKSFNRIPAQGLDNHSQGVQRPIANHFHPPLFSPFSSDWILRTTLYLARHPIPPFSSSPFFPRFPTLNDRVEAEIWLTSTTTWKLGTRNVVRHYVVGKGLNNIWNSRRSLVDFS